MRFNDAYSDSVMISLGRDSNLVDPNLRLDKIVEIKSIGADSAEVEREWKFIDHLIQDFDSTKPNFRVNILTVSDSKFPLNN
jgi:hypothetical protein